MSKKEKKQTTKPLLKEQDQIDLELKIAGQEHTNEAGFEHSEETLALGNRADSDDSWLWSGSPDELLAQGTLVDQKYEIIMLLGTGGMGSVYLAKHLELGTRVALKVLHRHLVNTPSALERFKSEARAAHSLSSKNLVSVLDYGVLSDGQPYLTMHCIDGINLADYLKSKGTLSIGETFSVVRQVAAALEEAHGKGIVHRDIKPSNILIEGNTIKEGSVKVVDFGISKGLSNESSSQQVTHTGQVFGSPFYMSPEQCKGEAVDSRTDLYSLGCVMFECLTGSWPFHGSTAIETLMMHCNEKPPTLGVKGKPPKGFAQAKAVLKKLLAKDPAQRFANAAALSEALQGIEIEGGQQKLFAFGRAQAGDKRYREELKQVALLLFCLFLLYQYLSLTISQQRLAADADARMQELFSLTSTDDFRPRQTDDELRIYLKKAINFAEVSFGKNSAQAAEAHNRMGKYLRDRFHKGGEKFWKAAIEELSQAVQVADNLPTLSSAIKQKYILDLADIVGDDIIKAKLYSQALSIGPIPTERRGETNHWYGYQLHLQKQGKYLEAAHDYVDTQMQKKLSLPSIKDLSAQKVESVLGRFGHPSNEGKTVQAFSINLAVKDNKVVGTYSIKHKTYGRPTKPEEPAEIAKQTLTGNFADGVLHCQLNFGRQAFPYKITRVGKYLVILQDPLKMQLTGKYPYHQPPNDLLLTAE